MSLPNITKDDLLGFEDALSKTSSPKEQKQHLRSLLILATGNKLKALAAQKVTNVITNVTGEQPLHFYYSFFNSVLVRLLDLMVFVLNLFVYHVKSLSRFKIIFCITICSS